MSSVANPAWGMLVPGGMNPTGNILPNPVLSRTSPTGTNPMLPNVNFGPSSPLATNPFGGSSSVPTMTPFSGAGGRQFPANVGPFPSTLNLGPSGSQFKGASDASVAANSPFAFLQMMTPQQIGSLYHDLKKTYGSGMANLLLDFITSGAGFNQQAINNLLASLQPEIERGQENIMEQFSVMGNRFGSPAAVGLADYQSRVALDEGQLITQMYEDAINRMLGIITGTAGDISKRIASSPSFWDQFGHLITTGAGAALGALAGGPAGAVTGATIGGKAAG